MEFNITATATFGLEAVVRREVEALGYEDTKTENGKVTFRGGPEAVAEANLHLRCADRVLINVGEFEAKDFTELFDRVKDIPWEEYIDRDGRFPVSCTTVKSTLHNPPAIQSISKKAIASRLGEVRGQEIVPENGALYPVKITIHKDKVDVTIDTSGEGLHKRGYRKASVNAPIKETMAAALVSLSFWNRDRILVDPCCGSGTIPIEAAMIARNIPPGLGRSFICEEWSIIGRDVWKEARRKAFAAIDYDAYPDIRGCDISPKAVAAAVANAEEAGVDDCIDFSVADAADLEARGNNGVIITNPPYGIRIGEKDEIEKVYKALGSFCRRNRDWSLFMITTDPRAEKKVMGRKADRRRKLYNGRLETTYYQFHGQRV
ncbi:MAG: class I SAM-dependent RNA methyltransferase [Clostridiales bacterium]|nr:class I SAM-dependent RNA methyltransferase [Clostridiales bacterium]MDD7034643.1 class I SAM-dependent RNA methyltransferase [Bacillota bacterium]MDY2919728.1 class I SAM-dependent RNA methyltransferase [Lentihominibacter sp.]